MIVIAGSHFKYNGRDIRPRDEVDMSELEYSEFRRYGMVRLPDATDKPKDQPARGTYRRRDVRAVD